MRRDFWRRSLAAVTGFLFEAPFVSRAVAAPAAVEAEREPWQADPEPEAPPLPVAPLGPPPLCTVPRGWHRMPLRYDDDPERYRAEYDRRHEGTLTWGQLKSYAMLAEQALGYWPRTWGDVAHSWSLHPVGSALAGCIKGGRRDVARFYAREIERAGVRLSDPVPDREWLSEIGGRCHEWCDGTGVFADGKEYRLPSTAVSAGFLYRAPESLRRKLMDLYEDAGAPWGPTEMAGGLYIAHVGEQELERQTGRRWDGERFVPLEEGGGA